MNDTAAPQDPTDHATDARLEALEVKASFADDALDTLSDLVHRQQMQIERLVRELVDLRDQLAQVREGSPRSLRDELPPHY